MQAAITRYKAKAATAVVMDARSGAMVAAVSLPAGPPPCPTGVPAPTPPRISGDASATKQKGGRKAALFAGRVSA